MWYTLDTTHWKSTYEMFYTRKSNVAFFRWSLGGGGRLTQNNNLSSAETSIEMVLVRCYKNYFFI